MLTSSRRIALALPLLTVLVYAPAIEFPFINFDDPLYLTEVPEVQDGLTWGNVWWAMTALEAGFWHPLTWLSHMLDSELFGMDAGGHHLSSVLLHAVSALVLFLALFEMTGGLWKSALAAGLFAVHPLNVESVAWVAERKNVLSTLFWMLAMWAYVKYARERTAWRYGLVSLLFVLGLAAKPMLVTFPFVLLLLDYWPLRRWEGTGAECSTGPVGRGPAFGGRAAARRAAASTAHRAVATPDPAVAFSSRTTRLRLILEKLPMFIPVGIVSVLTIQAEEKVRALSGGLPLVQRLGNAILSYGLYLKKMVWPIDLAIFYPHAGENLSWGAVIGAGILLAGLTAVAVRLGRKHGYVLVGWLWYLGTLVPVSGLIQVGGHAMADRYAYIPLIGIFVAAVWGGEWLARELKVQRVPIVLGALCLIAVLTVVTRIQLGHWSSSAAVFRHAIAVTGANPVAHNYLGAALGDQGQWEAATDHFAQAISLQPAYPAAYCNLGVVLARQGRLPEAIQSFEHAIALDPGFTHARRLLAKALAETKKGDSLLNAPIKGHGGRGP